MSHVRVDIQSLDDFCSHIALSVGLKPDQLTPESHIPVDLELDSLGALELLVLLEEVTGSQITLPCTLSSLYQASIAYQVRLSLEASTSAY
jgi:hypothetical protein